MLRATLLSLLLVLSTPSTVRADERPNFSGTWQLNEELSEDPREKMREQRSRGGFGRGGAGGGFGRGGAGGGFGRGGAGGGFGRGGAGGGSGGGQGQGQRQGRGGGQGLGQGAERLEIVHDGASFSVTDAAERSRQVEIDGEVQALTSPNGGSIELSGEWKRGDRVELNMQRPERPAITETYELIADGARLYVDVEIESSGRRPALKFRRVYDRVVADEGRAPVEDEPTPSPENDSAG